MDDDKAKGYNLELLTIYTDVRRLQYFFRTAVKKAVN